MDTKIFLAEKHFPYFDFENNKMPNNRDHRN